MAPRIVAIAVVLGLLLTVPMPVAPGVQVRPPLVGFSFSPKAAAAAGLDPGPALSTLLSRLRPDLVRMPVYWDTVAPAAGQFDFRSVDDLIHRVAAYNLTSPHRRARVLLVVGARNILYPEVHLPTWSGVADLARLSRFDPYRDYLTTTVERYAGEPLLYAWQVENEPLDWVASGFAGRLDRSAQAIGTEVGLLKAVDAIHPVVVTTFNSATLALDEKAASPLAALLARLPGPKSAGHPQEALAIADALGLDLYAVTADTPLDEADAATRIGWKKTALAYWSGRAQSAGKAVWVTEMQAQPWGDSPGFTTDDLEASAAAYRGSGAAVVLLWGVESWLGLPSWMASGRRAVGILRSGPGGFEPGRRPVPGNSAAEVR
ncbi:MAG: hypothetical protein NVS9B1_01230 [Candidatus Dormibacteraceae bacterium]